MRLFIFRPRRAARKEDTTAFVSVLLFLLVWSLVRIGIGLRRREAVAFDLFLAYSTAVVAALPLLFELFRLLSASRRRGTPFPDPGSIAFPAPDENVIREITEGAPWTSSSPESSSSSSPSHEHS